MRFIHYSDELIDAVRPACYIQELNHKPHGFWFSVEHQHENLNWKQWCESEEFALEKLKYPHLLHLHNNANILCIKSIEDMFTFNKLYLEIPDKLKGHNFRIITNFHINWKKVSSDYDGIIITPYQWTCRLHNDFFWYYTWDCSSGCVWNLEVIKSIYKLEENIKCPNQYMEKS